MLHTDGLNWDKAAGLVVRTAVNKLIAVRRQEVKACKLAKAEASGANKEDKAIETKRRKEEDKDPTSMRVQEHLDEAQRAIEDGSWRGAAPNTKPAMSAEHPETPRR